MKTHRKTYILLMSVLLSITSLSTFAGWQVSKPESTIPREPFFQTGRTQQKVFYQSPAKYTPITSYARHTSYSPVASYTPTTYNIHAFPRQYGHLGQAAPVYAVSISGSLKENLERIMGRYHWRVIWKAPFDYNFDGRVTGSSLPNVIEKLLQPFPLQAVMYMSNRTLAVVSRNKP